MKNSPLLIIIGTLLSRAETVCLSKFQTEMRYFSPKKCANFLALATILLLLILDTVSGRQKKLELVQKKECTVSSGKELLTDEFWDSKERAREFTGQLYRRWMKYHSSSPMKRLDFTTLIYELQSCEQLKLNAAIQQFDELTVDHSEDFTIPESHLIQAINAAIEASAQCTMNVNNILNRKYILPIVKDKVVDVLEWVLVFREAVEKHGCMRKAIAESIASMMESRTTKKATANKDHLFS